MNSPHIKSSKLSDGSGLGAGVVGTDRAGAFVGRGVTARLVGTGATFAGLVGARVGLIGSHDKHVDSHAGVF